MSLTAEQQAELDEYCDKYDAMLTEQAPFEDIEAIVHKVWEKMGLAAPKVHLVDTIMHAYKAISDEGLKDPSSFSSYFTIWFHSYAAMFEWAKNNGENIDEDELECFLAWTNCCPAILFDDDEVYVSRCVKSVSINEDNQLHNTEGPCLTFHDSTGEFAEECKIWYINGVQVTEQIVMDPKSQTMADILGEENEEVKRIRIEQYGWSEFLKEVDAKLLDQNEDAVAGTEEFLFEIDQDGTNLRALLCICPSTGKEFVLEVPPDTKDCQSAQVWLSGGLSSRVISAS
jgi:hypothetical protein